MAKEKFRGDWVSIESALLLSCSLSILRLSIFACSKHMLYLNTKRLRQILLMLLKILLSKCIQSDKKLGVNKNYCAYLWKAVCWIRTVALANKQSITSKLKESHSLSELSQWALIQANGWPNTNNWWLFGGATSNNTRMLILEGKRYLTLPWSIFLNGYMNHALACFAEQLVSLSSSFVCEYTYTTFKDLKVLGVSS